MCQESRTDPADKGTRGLSEANLATDQSWWTGPEFLQHCAEQRQQMRITIPQQLPGEMKKKLAMSFATQADSWRLEPIKSVFKLEGPRSGDFVVSSSGSSRGADTEYGAI